MLEQYANEDDDDDYYISSGGNYSYMYDGPFNQANDVSLLVAKMVLFSIFRNKFLKINSIIL